MYRTALFLSLAVATAAQATPQLPRHAELDLRTARQLADASLAHCTAALTVLDRGGNLLLGLRADGVGPHNSLASQRKAYTALSTKTRPGYSPSVHATIPKPPTLTACPSCCCSAAAYRCSLTPNWSVRWASPGPVALRRTKPVPSRLPSNWA